MPPRLCDSHSMDSGVMRVDLHSNRCHVDHLYSPSPSTYRSCISLKRRLSIINSHAPPQRNSSHMSFPKAQRLAASRKCSPGRISRRFLHSPACVEVADMCRATRKARST